MRLLLTYIFSLIEKRRSLKQKLKAANDKILYLQDLRKRLEESCQDAHVKKRAVQAQFAELEGFADRQTARMCEMEKELAALKQTPVVTPALTRDCPDAD